LETKWIEAENKEIEMVAKKAKMEVETEMEDR